MLASELFWQDRRGFMHLINGDGAVAVGVRGLKQLSNLSRRVSLTHQARLHRVKLDVREGTRTHGGR